MGDTERLGGMVGQLAGAVRLLAAAEHGSGGQFGVERARRVESIADSVEAEAESIVAEAKRSGGSDG